jgi:hypothetical protein
MIFAKENGVTVWKVRFRDAPGGMQDFKMEEETLMEAINLYVKQIIMDCKIMRPKMTVMTANRSSSQK